MKAQGEMYLLPGNSLAAGALPGPEAWNLSTSGQLTSPFLLSTWEGQGKCIKNAVKCDAALLKVNLAVLKSYLTFRAVCTNDEVGKGFTK